MRYRLYIDESGDHNYRDVETMGHRYLCLVGVAIETEYYRDEFQPHLELLKQQHFPHSPDEPVILHRVDIYNRRSCFGVLNDPSKNEQWERSLIKFVKEAKFTLFAVVIDKKGHLERYGSSAHHPYNLCLTFILERYKGFLNYSNSKGDVLAESRGKNEDAQLSKEYKHIWECGTYYNSARTFQSALTSKNIKFRKKAANIGGLQMADLLAHPAKMDIVNGESDSGWQTCYGKQIIIACNDKFNLYGKKLF